jgi:hypothetical protein
LAVGDSNPPCREPHNAPSRRCLLEVCPGVAWRDGEICRPGVDHLDDRKEKVVFHRADQTSLTGHLDARTKPTAPGHNHRKGRRWSAQSRFYALPFWLDIPLSATSLFLPVTSRARRVVSDLSQTSNHPRKMSLDTHPWTLDTSSEATAVGLADRRAPAFINLQLQGKAATARPSLPFGPPQSAPGSDARGGEAAIPWLPDHLHHLRPPLVCPPTC